MSEEGDSNLSYPTGLYSSPIVDRNPSPPPTSKSQEADDDELNAEICIGGTVFSKHWVFTTLMKLIKEVDKEEVLGVKEDDKCNESKEDVQDKKDCDTKVEKTCSVVDTVTSTSTSGCHASPTLTPSSVESSTASPCPAALPSSSTSPIDIDEEIENELCKLWDMSMNQDVAVFLHEWKTEDILVGVIAKTNAPRATEICIGILANMACNEDIVIDMSKKERFIEVVLALLECTDPPTLVETTRLIYSCISNSTAASYWLSVLKTDPAIYDTMCFVLQSSTNGDLLHNMSDLVDKLLDMDDELLEMWSSSTLLLAICEAIQQVRKPRPKTLEYLLHSLQLLSTTEKGVESIGENGSTVCPLISDSLHAICSEESVTLVGRETELAAAVSVLDTLITSKSNGIKYLQSNEGITSDLLVILNEIKPILRRPSSTSSSLAAADEEQMEKRKAKTLQNVIVNLMSTVLKTRDGNTIICNQLKKCPRNHVKTLKGTLKRKGVDDDIIQTLEWEL
ncbi:protein saal1-like [Saccoglossus kowalevskii]|uniref:Protein SAAL1-like n=1 Tax=Saccoglossus kowalevskii TaxID=10224 RepID=A0ABM0GLN8_SACKO|nr:PREDICTED: protein SAAL1-like [Saccoglossus kowalevskii]